MQFTYGAITDAGDLRTENQDSVLCISGTIDGNHAALFVVADGMGGLSYGSQVSSFITRQFATWWKEDFPAMVRVGRTGQEDMKELLEQEIWDVNQSLLRFKEESGSRSGSTLSLLLLFGNEYYIENMGDSRVYQLRQGQIRCLTKDQSLVAQLVRENRMSEEEAKSSRKKNVLTMCLGMFEKPQSFFAQGTLEDGDRFLLCSDGLHNHLEVEEMEEVLNQAALSSQKKAWTIRQMIKPGTADDNVSVVVVE